MASLVKVKVERVKAKVERAKAKAKAFRYGVHVAKLKTTLLLSVAVSGAPLLATMMVPERPRDCFM